MALAPGSALCAESNPTWSDPEFNKPYIDKDEWRDAPVRHRYVHGGFTGTAARFSIYLPPVEQYDGRFFQQITTGPASENASQTAPFVASNIAFAVTNGAYYVESNQGDRAVVGQLGAPSQVDPAIAGYRVSAATAQYSRQIASQMYGVHRTYGYTWGHTPAALRQVGGMENTQVWDGAVPYTMLSPVAVPNVYSVVLHVVTTLRGKFDALVDTVDVGGSGDPYASLSAEEAAVLREATEIGFPIQTWFRGEDLKYKSFLVLSSALMNFDPTYVNEFWSLPGYEGSDPASSIHSRRFRALGRVKRVIHSNEAADFQLGGPPSLYGQPSGNANAKERWRQFETRLSDRPFPVAFELDRPIDTDKDLFGAAITPEGSSEGLYVSQVKGSIVAIQVQNIAGANIEITSKIRPGQQLAIDNGNVLAMGYFYRHQILTPDFVEFAHLRRADGHPRYPQRPQHLGVVFAKGLGPLPTGRFSGKMIMIGTMMNQDSLPIQSDWYYRKARHYYGEGISDKLRLWFHEHALHGDPARGEETRVTSGRGAVQQALLDLSAWVEKGVPPPASTEYKVEAGQVKIPASAAQRKGHQQTVKLTANGGAIARVRIGEQVQLAGLVEMPSGAGQVVQAAWDLDGSGAFAEPATVAPGAMVRLDKTTIFHTPGTHFVTLRTVSSRTADASSPFGQIENLARVRVVVV